MLTGELPFKGEYDQAIIYSILNEEPQAVKKNESQQSILKVVNKALYKDGEKRYRHISDMIDDLKSKSLSIAGSGDNNLNK